MCGIMGYVGEGDVSQIIEEGLSKLEYRGYDSAGFAKVLENKIFCKKEVEGIKKLFLDVESIDDVTTGVGHTRWATHGAVSPKNAHPHLCCDREIAVVHNGIIENHKDIRNDLGDHVYRSDTDSEVAVHFIEEKIQDGKTILEALEELRNKIEGTYAILVINKAEEKIFVCKEKSPLALGVGESGNYVASDIYAFSGFTERAIFLEDGDLAIVEKDKLKVFDKKGETVEREITDFKWDEKRILDDEYDHHMIREIKEQPEAVKRLLESYKTFQKDSFEKLADEINSCEKLIITGSGSSFHASKVGAKLFRELGFDSKSVVASEFDETHVGDGTVVLAVSQSGETMDVLDAIQIAKENGCDVLSMVNVPYSSIQRKSDLSIELLAGQEICVASTKTFTNQLLTFYILSKELGKEMELERLVKDIEKTLEKNEEIAKVLAGNIGNESDIYVLGRNRYFPIAKEIALKLKEISYIHAEGLRGGELKHGTLALIEEGTPVISLIPDKHSDIISNVEEVESRGAKSLRASPFYGVFDIPESDFLAILFAITGFILTYYTARERDLPIDKPRNLAKSVTVR